MTKEKLEKALVAVDWSANVSAFLKDPVQTEAIAKANFRLAVWSKQFEATDRSNPALAFVREMQAAGHHVAALIALGLYKPAAGSMRTAFETALYYTYFRTHKTELTTLLRNSEFFVSKQEVIDFHKLHSRKFTLLQQSFGLISQMNGWYSEMSGLASKKRTVRTGSFS